MVFKIYFDLRLVFLGFILKFWVLLGVFVVYWKNYIWYVCFFINGGYCFYGVREEEMSGF